MVYVSEHLHEVICYLLRRNNLLHRCKDRNAKNDCPDFGAKPKEIKLTVVEGERPYVPNGFVWRLWERFWPTRQGWGGALGPSKG